MDNFLHTYNLPKSNQEQISNLNRHIAPNEIEVIIKNLPTKRSPRPDSFSEESCQTFKEELMPIPLKLFHKIETERTLSNSFYEITVTLIT